MNKSHVDRKESKVIISTTMRRTCEFFNNELNESDILVFKGPADNYVDNSSIEGANIFSIDIECVQQLCDCWLKYIWNGLNVSPWDPSQTTRGCF